MLDREALNAFRASFPVHLDADEFELWPMARPEAQVTRKLA